MRVPELSLTFEQVFLMVWVANLVALAITLGFLLGVCRSRCISEWRQELDSDDDKQAGICPAHRDQQLVVGDRKWSGGGKAVRPFSGSGGDGTPPGRGEHSSGASRRRQPPIVETSILPRYQFFVWVLAFALAVRVVLLSIDFPSPPGWFRGAVYAGTPKYALLAFVSPLWYALYWIADEVAAHSLLVLPCLPVPSSSAVVRSSIVGTVFAIGGTALTWTAFIAAVVAASSPDPDALAGSLRLQRVMDVVMFSVTGTVYAVAVTGSGLGWTVRSAFSPYFVVSAVWRLAYAAALAANVYGSVIGVAVVSLKTLALPSLFIGALAADTRFWPAGAKPLSPSRHHAGRRHGRAPPSLVTPLSPDARRCCERASPLPGTPPMAPLSPSAILPASPSAQWGPLKSPDGPAPAGAAPLSGLADDETAALGPADTRDHAAGPAEPAPDGPAPGSGPKLMRTISAPANSLSNAFSASLRQSARQPLPGTGGSDDDDDDGDDDSEVAVDLDVDASLDALDRPRDGAGRAHAAAGAVGRDSGGGGASGVLALCQPAAAGRRHERRSSDARSQRSASGSISAMSVSAVTMRAASSAERDAMIARVNRAIEAINSRVAVTASDRADLVKLTSMRRALMAAADPGDGTRGRAASVSKAGAARRLTAEEFVHDFGGRGAVGISSASRTVGGAPMSRLHHQPLPARPHSGGGGGYGATAMTLPSGEAATVAGARAASAGRRASQTVSRPSRAAEAAAAGSWGASLASAAHSGPATASHVGSDPSPGAWDRHRRSSAAAVQGLRWELMENVRVTDLLGSGSFAAVYKCSVQTSVFAIKKFHNVDLASTQQAAVAPNEALQAAFELLVEQDSHAAMADTGRMLALRRMHNILSEVLICARLSASPYIVTCHGAASDWGEVGVLFEYCNKGTLTSAIKEQDMTVARRLRYAVQIAKAIRHVHSTEPATIHGDIKSDNILLKSTGRSSAGVEDSRALLGDFGEAVSTARLLAGDTEAKRQRGTPLWMAPEQLRAGNRVTSSSTATDIYTFGHVLGHLWNLQLPWHKEREEEQRERDGSPSSENIRVQILRFVMRQQRPALLFAENEVGAAFKKVYDACLDPDPKKRPDADSVVHQLIGVQCVLRDALLAAPEVIREQLDWDPWCSADRGNLVDFADDVEVTADEADPMAAFFA
ncbi:hypothetical protein FNF29_02578 [Cafeteria roenbergensis]|uniref:Protein kinase domain-containing protein n=1 Tax=Cafeteria roenbergensis TaxID=33653 RepID=A0A5A8CNQ8_CAFRO|nr:hypothetical protein FNF29_02578 [Cafeteria roenbergensis]|eukprot:KAA0154358.1 hypothetical protein FNF29_02578 [Cafeteria roenbergensis]